MSTNWKAGDIAICVKTDSGERYSPLRLKAEYMVQAVRTCECGNVTLDVGIAFNHDDNAGILYKCGAHSSPKSGIWWCNSIRFVKKQEDSETKEEIEKQLELALANEDYLKAAELSKKLK